MRREQDYIGEEILPDDVYYGLSTLRAAKIFDVSGCRWQRVFIKSLAQVKQAALLTLQQLEYLEDDKAEALLEAARLLEQGELDGHIVVDPLQGGAGTATNFNVNEVLANKALELMGHPKGSYDIIHPLDDVNRYQSTNDVFPTASRLAVIYCLQELEPAIEQLQLALQEKEQVYAGLLKSGRTQYQAAVPVSLGMEFGAWAEAVARDRWRVYKSFERIKVVNLGGTAVGTGITAPRRYIFRVIDNLRKLTGLRIARAENLVEATANNDAYAEVSGIIRAHAANLIKIANDLRYLSSDDCGEISLRPLLRGSTIMPGKVNPVVPELMVQAGIKVLGNDSMIVQAVSGGHLELNPLLPLITYALIESMQILRNVDNKACEYCIKDIQANEARLQDNFYRSNALITALIPHLGYTKAESIGQYMQEHDLDIRQANEVLGFFAPAELERLLTAENLLKLGEDD
ncbi:MAG TPA: aspartate ammonia-lyase [Syntrophomonas sp.]|nr:aspartate ammonia-lyase [Syntrophomonas sp.]